MRRLLITALVIASAARPWRIDAQQVDVIRGRVTVAPPAGAGRGSAIVPRDTASLEGVTVRATSAYGGVMRTDVTKKDGRFNILFNEGEGDYWIEFSKIGFAPQRREIKRIGTEEVLIINARMVSLVASLDTVFTTTTRSPVRGVPNRNAADPDVSGGARAITGADLPPDLAGNLAAMLTGIPGMQIVPGMDGAPDMFTALGLGTDQNAITFDGLGSGIMMLPPDIIASASLIRYNYDPAVGGFSGAQIAIASSPGSNFSRRLVSHGNIVPPLEWTDAFGTAQAQKYTSVRLGGNAAGPIVLNKAFYNTSWNVSRRSSDVRTLLGTNAALNAAGVSSDSAARFFTILRGLGVPLSVADVPDAQRQTSAQAQANFNLAPSSSGTGGSYLVGLLGNFAGSDPIGNGPLTSPAHAGASTRWSGSSGITHTRLFGILGVGVLSKTTVGLALSSSSVDRYLTLPEGTVRVRSTLADGTSPVRSLQFGGSGAQSDNRTSAVQAQNALSWFSADNHHTFKLTTSVTRASFSDNNGAGILGRFAFNSLADLEAGHAARFSRALSHRTQSATQISAAVALGDYWRPTQTLQFQYGLRVDANRFSATPAFNEQLRSAFGIRNDVVPNNAYVSPRVGVQWTYGVAPTIAYTRGAARPPAGVVHAGVGVFQNIAGPQLIGSALTSTGLANSAQTMACAGDAVPNVDWTGFLTNPGLIPAQCADGSAGTVFASSAPSVALFGARYRQPRSIRGSADWSGPIFDNRFMFGVQGVVTHALHQRGAIDVNVDPTTRFTLSNEGGRPVFANPDAIVPATGAIAPADGRVSQDFQRVSVLTSALRLDSRLLSVSISPVTPSRRLKWGLTYSLLDGAQTFYGFSSTGGNPFDVSRGPLLQGGRHSVSLNWRNFPLFDFAYVSANVRMESGTRYTPLIAGDVNGDGASNDRAYIFDPSIPRGTDANAEDASLMAGMQSLLQSGAQSGRDCIARQVGTIAGYASCRAPWTTTVDLAIRFNPAKLGLPKRATVAIGFQNVLGLADLAFHGAGNIRGWGQATPPDPTLLFVRGFDATTRTFRYDVNQRFGSTRPRQSTGRSVSSLSMSVSIDVGLPREQQVLLQRLDAGRSRPGMKSDDRQIWQIGVASIPNPISMILQSDSALKLTRAQSDSLASLSIWFSVYADSIWTPDARALAALPDKYDRGEAWDRYVRARARTVDYLLAVVKDVKGVLTASQRRKLPLQVSMYLDEKVLRFLRSSSVGDASALIGR